MPATLTVKHPRVHTLYLLLFMAGLTACGGGSGGGATPPPPDNNPAPFKPRANDTGITTCGGSLLNNSSCPLASFPGQDGDHGRDVDPAGNSDSDGRLGFAFTKRDADGAALPAAAGSWKCVRDEVTGLIWEAKTDDNGLHDGRAIFKWGGGGISGFCYILSTCDTDTFIAAVNSEALCGYTDWRLPKMEELQSIADYSKVTPGPFLDTNYFPHYIDLNGYLQEYWSASRRIDVGSGVWFFEVSSGQTPSGNQSGERGVRLVRGGTPPGGAVTPQAGQTCDAGLPATAPDNRYIDNNDGTLTDKQTGLMWPRCPVAYTFSDNGTPTDWMDDTCTPTGLPTGSWQGALNATASLNMGTGFAGHNDWRLPNIKEIYSLTEHSCTGVTMNKTAFPAKPISFFWSSSPVSGSNEVWTYVSTLGYIYQSGKTSNGHLYLVRDAD